MEKAPSEQKEIGMDLAEVASGLEATGTVWSFLDRAPFGRQETWEDSPAGYPQGETYTWWRRHDEYEERS
jgi:predicted dithiol-disulfide oxidoreductase (DUF899 family)